MGLPDAGALGAVAGTAPSGKDETYVNPFSAFSTLNSRIASLDRSNDLAMITRNARRLSTDELVPKRILVPSDFSPASDHAFTYASHLGSHFCTKLHVIHVLESVLSSKLAGLPETAAFSKEEVAAAKKAFRAWANSAGAAAAAKLVFRNGFAVHGATATSS